MEIKKLKKQIMGMDLELIFKKNKSYSKNLEEELSIYSESTANDNLKIYIDIKKEPETISNNPSTQFSSENIFGIETTFLKIFWIKNEKTIKEIIIKTKYSETNQLLRLFHFFVGKDLEKPHNLIVQQLNELVFVPTIFFKEDKTIFHGSCIEKEDETILIGGTGGVGKTSALLSLNNKENIFFLADDMTIIDAKKNIYPNLAYPKIYAYNLVGNKALKRKVLRNLNIFKRILFNMISNLSKDRVRKRMDPNKLFLTKNHSSKLTKYLILSKFSENKIIEEKISASKAAENSWRIIETEYCRFISHLKWHKFNCEINNMKNNFNYDQIKNKKININKKILLNNKNFLIKIPKDMEHKEYLKEIKKIL